MVDVDKHSDCDIRMQNKICWRWVMEDGQCETLNYIR